MGMGWACRTYRRESKWRRTVNGSDAVGVDGEAASLALELPRTMYSVNGAERPDTPHRNARSQQRAPNRNAEPTARAGSESVG